MEKFPKQSELPKESLPFSIEEIFNYSVDNFNLRLRHFLGVEKGYKVLDLNLNEDLFKEIFDGLIRKKLKGGWLESKDDYLECLAFIKARMLKLRKTHLEALDHENSSKG